MSFCVYVDKEKAQRDEVILSRLLLRWSHLTCTQYGMLKFGLTDEEAEAGTQRGGITLGCCQLIVGPSGRRTWCSVWETL